MKQSAHTELYLPFGMDVSLLCILVCQTWLVCVHCVQFAGKYVYDYNRRGQNIGMHVGKDAL